MKLAEKHALESMAITLEQSAETAYKRTYGILNDGWSRKTATAFRNAARAIRKQLEENR